MPSMVPDMTMMKMDVISVSNELHMSNEETKGLRLIRIIFIILFIIPCVSLLLSLVALTFKNTAILLLSGYYIFFLILPTIIFLVLEATFMYRNKLSLINYYRYNIRTRLVVILFMLLIVLIVVNIQLRIYVDENYFRL